MSGCRENVDASHAMGVEPVELGEERVDKSMTMDVEGSESTSSHHRDQLDGACKVDKGVLLQVHRTCAAVCERVPLMITAEPKRGDRGMHACTKCGSSGGAGQGQ